MMKQTTRMLPVPLTDDEVAVKAQLLSQKLAEYDAAEAEKKEATKDFSDQMKELRSQYTELRGEVRTKTAKKLVDCWQEPNLARRVWEVRRADTNEVVESIPMTAHEIDEARQLDIEDRDTTVPPPAQRTPKHA